MNGKIPSVIRWTRSDYARLSYAVRQFNKKVRELETLEEDVLPEGFDYQQLKQSIFSRRELNRVVKSLKRFNKESQQRLVTTEAGEVITQWEYSELKKAMKRATTRLEQEARMIVESDINVMGDREFKQKLRTKESIQDLFNRTGKKFQITSKRAKFWGKNDFELYQASIYRENFMNSLEKMSNYDNYELLKEKLESIKNPIQFYNYVSKSNILKDLFLYYMEEATAQIYGGFSSNQEAFDTAIFDQLGIIPNEDNIEEYYEEIESMEIEDIFELKRLELTGMYLILYQNRKKKGVFLNGEKAYDYVTSNNLTEGLSIKIIKNK